ncbi:DNA polymerase, partial [Paramuricea clavata]
MERKIKECQTIAELLALESQSVFNELEERLVFEKRMEIFLRIKEWRLENARLGLVPDLTDTWTPEQRESFLRNWQDGELPLQIIRSQKRAVDVNVVHVEMPHGGTGTKRAEINLEKHLMKKRSIIRIRNNDQLCLARALVVAKAKIDNDPQYTSIVDHRRAMQTRLARELHQKAAVPLGPCGLDEVKQFQTYLSDYQINIVSKDHQNALIYIGPDQEKRIYLYLHDNHYDIITKMPGFFARKKYCHACKKAYDHREDHLCPNACPCCRFPDCPVESWVRCNDCNRMFKSQACFDRHKQSSEKSICATMVKCSECHRIIKRYKRDSHHCGMTKCPICKEYTRPGDHRCYMQPVEKRNEDLSDSDDSSEHPEDDVTEGGYDQMLFFDFECRQENGNHEPNLCVIQNEAGDEWVFEGDNTRNEFCEWLFQKERANCIMMAHNFQGYDSYFILQYLRENGVKYDVIVRGAKVLSLSVDMFKIKFIDSLNFIPMRLADFPKTFGIDELAKGYFPHLFNKKENENYVGPVPPAPYYNPNGMSPAAKETFLRWHKNLKDNDYVFNFQEEILAYCRSDVDILRRCCLEFRELFRDVTKIDPFEKCLTIASACNLVYRTNYLRENTIAIIPPRGYCPENKQSLLAQKWLSYTSEQNEIYIQHARNGGEKRVGPYLLDGYHEETRTAYEVHGCFWHGCINCYARDTINPVKGKTMHDLHQKTVEKIQYLKNQGYNVVEVWECRINRELAGNEDMKHYFIQYDGVDPLEPRDALYGGRTNASRLYHECNDDEKIRYVDFTSLYPWCNKMTRTVVGHPRIITENFDDISTYFGLVKCTVLPPRGLFHPVLPYRTQGKLMFPLCKTCADACNQTPCDHADRERAIQGTWCSVELEKALEKSYQIVRIHEVWHFPETSDDLFKDYIDTFLKIKQEASGYPKDSVTEEQKRHYVDEYLEKSGIHLDPHKIEYNPGLRALAKLMLNSFWGKFAQRPNMVKTEQIKDPQVFFDYLTSDEINVLDADLVSDDIIEIRYEYTDNFIKPDAKTNVERVMYYDTDSVIFISKLNEPEPPLGNHLGQLTDELGGEYITVFASGGPKNYCYRTNSGKVETKVRGITLDCTARQKVNFEVICGLVYLHAKCQVTGQVSVDIPFRITRNTRTKEIETKRMKKDYRIVYNKRFVRSSEWTSFDYGIIWERFLCRKGKCSPQRLQTLYGRLQPVTTVGTSTVSKCISKP